MMKKTNQEKAEPDLNHEIPWSQETKMYIEEISGKIR